MASQRRVFSKVRSVHSRSKSNWTWRSGYVGAESEMESWNSGNGQNPLASGVYQSGTKIECSLNVDGAGRIVVSRRGTVLHEIVIRAENPDAFQREQKEVEDKVLGSPPVNP